MVYDVKDFNIEVIEKSFRVPVLVDFWADWCAPCKMLGPVLERLTEKAKGEWILAKVNTEEMQKVALQYKISSIPNVKLFVDGNVAAEFVGALPEYQIEKWLAKVIPSKFRKEIEDAKNFISSTKIKEARVLLEKIIKSEPNNEQAKTLLAASLIFTEPDRVEILVKDISDQKYVEVAESIRTMERIFRLIKSPSELPDNPVKQKYLSAIVDLQSQNFNSALEKFIEIIRADRYYDDDGSRKACIAIFKFLGEENETVLKYRRDFSSALY